MRFSLSKSFRTRAAARFGQASRTAARSRRVAFCRAAYRASAALAFSASATAAAPMGKDDEDSELRDTLGVVRLTVSLSASARPNASFASLRSASQ